MPTAQEGTYYKRSRQRVLKQNEKHSTFILDTIKSMHAKNELNEFFKSHFYQSLYNLVSNNSLIPDTINFLLAKLDSFVIKRENQVYFNLEKCIHSHAFKIDEPIHVLFNCSVLVASKTKLTHTGEQLGKLKVLLNQISQTYLNNDPKWLFTQYKSQLTDRIERCGSLAASMKIVQQMQLGIYDSLMEYLVQSDAYACISNLLQKREATANLISVELEDLIRENKLKISTSTATKRKQQIIEHPIKKLKMHLNCGTQTESSYDEENKENMPQTSSTSKALKTAAAGRKPLERIENKPMLKKAFSQTPQNTAVTKLSEEEANMLRTLRAQSFANISFEYVPIMSYKTCLRLVQLYYSTNNSGSISAAIINDSSKFQALVKLLTDDKLLNYLINIVDKKLSTLLASESLDFYDPESLSSDDIFEFLSGLWVYV
jgi:hypothetical protein